MAQGRAASAPAASLSGWDRWASTSTRSFSSRSTSRPCSACCCCSPGSRTPASTRSPGGAARICCAPARSCCSACTARCRTRSRSISPTRILFTAFAVTWSGARVFDGRAPEPMYLVGGAILWILVSPHAVLRRLARRQGAALLRHHHRLHLGDGLRVLARPQRAAGVALARDLHAVRARRAVPAAHAARRRCCRGRRPARCSTACG